MKIDLMFLTCNRLDYTKLSLPALLSDPNEEFSLVIWDNGSTDGTKELISSLEDQRITRKVLSKENIGAVPAINEVLFNSSADLIGVVSDDLLVTPGWTRPIAQAHADVPEFGMIACWHLGIEHFDEARARHKIQRFGRHQVLRHPWTNGGAGLIKLKTLRQIGLFGADWGGYWIRVARKGYINGYYYPLIPVEHMDYPWSPYYTLSGKADGEIGGSTYKKIGIRTLEDAKVRHQFVVKNILDDPWDAKYYTGWRRLFRRIRIKARKLLGARKVGG